MNQIKAIGKFLDQPRLVSKFSNMVPPALILGAGAICYRDTQRAPKDKKKEAFIKSSMTLFGTISSALIATRGLKPLKIKGLFEQKGIREISKETKELVDTFIKQEKLTQKTKDILNKSKTRILNPKDINILFNNLENTKKGKEFLDKLIPNPQNITSKDIFKEMKKLSLMGLMPVLGGIGGGILGDKLAGENIKEKAPNKIKEGAYQYLANIFLCNVGAGIALGIMEKVGVKSKSTRALGMVGGIILTGIIGGSAIANFICKKVIDPVFEKNKDKKQKLYSERKPEALDIGLHTDDIATVAVMSGLKWIEPCLPVLYSISGYRAGIGYRNGENTNPKEALAQQSPTK